MSDIKSDLKNELYSTSEKYKEDLRRNLQNAVDSIGDTGKNAIVIGGILAGGFLLYKLMTPAIDKKKKKKKAVLSLNQPVDHSAVETYYEPKAPTVISKLTDRIMEEATVFLLALAKEKLLEYLNSAENDHSEDSK